MIEIIKNVIVKWDPISLMEFAPPDEYDQECIDIFQVYTEKCNPLSEIIYDVFSKAFGNEFKDDISKCIEIADEIETLLKKYNDATLS